MILAMPTTCAHGTGVAIPLYSSYHTAITFEPLCSHIKPEGLTSSPLRGPTQWLVYNGTQRFRLYTTSQLRGPSPGVHQGRSRVPRLRHTPARPGRSPWQMPGARMAKKMPPNPMVGIQRNPKVPLVLNKPTTWPNTMVGSSPASMGTRVRARHYVAGSSLV